MPDLRSAEPGDASAPHDVPGHPTGPRGPGPMRSLLAAAWSALARGADDALRARGLGAEAADPLRDRIRVAQFAEIKKQIPALYACLTANAVAVAFTHARLAPPWLTVGVLALLVPICIGRGIHWYRLDAGRVDAAEAAARMRRTVVLTAFLSLAFVVWAVMLDGYGGPFERGHVALFVAITVIACIFCLMHLPACALLVTAIVTAAFLAHYLTTGNAVFGAISLNLAFVVMVMVRVLRANYDSFLKLIHSQAALIRKQEEMRLLAEENFRLAHTDSLTGLPNRRYFFAALDGLRDGPDRAELALAIFDLDHFKSINDSYGHSAGDRVLAETGRRLGSLAGKAVRVARLGGDEFGALIDARALGRDVAAFCREVSDLLRQPFRAGDILLSPGCSCGVAFASAADRDGAALFDHADHALYQSKQHRRGAVTVYSKEQDDLIQAERAVEAALQAAGLEAELELHYQPVYDLASGSVRTVEALARWRSPLLGAVPPSRFIPVAERCGLIHRLTLLLLEKALGEIDHLPQAVGLSFNLSSHDLSSPEATDAIVALILRSGVAPSRLTFELTETALMADLEAAGRSVGKLRALGSRIALDDFGTGHSSLGYVHRLGLDRIKIDRSFVASVDTPTGEAIVKTILHLCTYLGLECVAEGVETEEQLDRLRGFGCRLVQGYLLGKPAPLRELCPTPGSGGILPRSRAA